MEFNKQTVIKMVYQKREKIECGWFEKKPAKSSNFNKAVNASKQELIGITLTSPSPKSKEINTFQTQPLENDLKQFMAIEIARHNAYR